MTRLLLPSLLFASLGLNAVLLVLRLLSPPAPVGEVSLPACQADLARLERRLAAARAASTPWLSPPARYDAAVPGTPCAAEPDLRPALDRVLAGTTHRLECRGRVCRLEVHPAPDDPGGWQIALLSDAGLSRLLEGFEVRASSTDPAAREVYLVLGDPRAQSGEDRLDAVLQDFRSSGHLAECARAHPGTGELTVELSAGGDGQLGMWVRGGSLTHTAGGACVGSALRGFLAAHSGGGPLAFARRVTTFRLGATGEGEPATGTASRSTP